MNNKLIFLHIPKTAGSSLHPALERQFKPTEIYSFRTPRELSLEKFTALSQKQKNSFRLIKGHLQFGLHEQLSPPFSYFTFLRDPVERVISEYYYACNTPGITPNIAIRQHNYSLKDYVASDVCPDNIQTRWIANMADRSDSSLCDNAALQTAKSNIENHFDFVGLTEDFDRAMILLAQTYGFKPLYYVVRNKNRRKKSNIDETTIELIKNYNQLDIDLYSWAKDLFESRWARAIEENESRLSAFKQYLTDHRKRLEYLTKFHYYYYRLCWYAAGLR